MYTAMSASMNSSMNIKNNNNNIYIYGDVQVVNTEYRRGLNMQT